MRNIRLCRANTSDRRNTALAACIATVALHGAVASAQNTARPPGELVILPSLPGGGSCDAYDVNDANVVVGECGFVPARWVIGPDGSASVEALSGPLIVSAPDGATIEAPILGGRATGINASGQIGGHVTALINSQIVSRAAMWQEGTWRDLGLPAGATWGTVQDIDDRGNVIGWLVVPPNIRATVWSSDGISTLPLLASGSSCLAYAGNDSDEVVGQCDFDDSGKRVPVIWKRKKGLVFELPNPRNPDSVDDYARSINERGLIGGIAASAAFVWNANNPDKSLSVAATGAVNGINDRNVMVGYVGVNGFAPQAAWWRNPGQAPELLFPGYPESFARSINSAGVVVGTIMLEDGNRPAFLAR